MNVQTIYDLIHTVAPFDTQMEGDNSGLLVGSPSQEVRHILFALDVTQPVIDEAVALGVELIVTHHPLMFSAIRSLTDETYEGRLIRRLVRENISLISAHTNLDKASGENIMELFKKINEEKGMTILQVTHSEKNSEYGSRVVKLDNGKLV